MKPPLPLVPDAAYASAVPERTVRPEWLDHLPGDDPEAIRSRRDLRLVNFLMGNERWIRRTVRRFPQAASRGIVEFGAGDGSLSTKLSRLSPGTTVTACDLAPRPRCLENPSILWRQGDILQSGGPLRGGILVANLFLHHFLPTELLKLGELCARFDVLVFNEPERARLSHVLGRLMRPFINRVTRHDLHTSIDAGFKCGEIPRLMGLDPTRWNIDEHSDWRGARRVVGLRI